MKNKYKIEAKDIREINNMDAIIIAVSHDCFRNLNIDDVNKMYKTNLKNKILIDIKGIFEKNVMKEKIIFIGDFDKRRIENGKYYCSCLQR